MIGSGVERLIKEARRFNDKINILLISPIHLGEEVWKTEFDPEFNQESVKVSKDLKGVYEKIAKQNGCEFLAASDIAEPSVQDQEHLNETGHKNLANAIYNKVVRF